MSTGRPLRFLGLVMGGWIGLRAVVLWPGGEVVSVVPGIGRAYAAPPAFAATPPPPHSEAVRQAYLRHVPQAATGAFVSSPPVRVVVANAVAPSTPVSQIPVPAKAAAESLGRQALLPPPPRRVDAAPSRWNGSAWVIARASGTGGGLDASQLGGSQAGARVAYAFGSARRVALVGRVATPLEGGGREAALGVEWRPAGLPLRLFAEQRIALDGGRGGPSAGVVGGVDRRLALGFRLEAFGQAGVIERDGMEGFADGAARVTRKAAAFGRATLDVGAGAWGGAQRGAARLDLGPTLGLSAPVAGRSFRLTLDYRARVAGRARPASGPALSLGADF